MSLQCHKAGLIPGLDLIPGLGIPYAVGWPKKKKKNKNKSKEGRKGEGKETKHNKEKILTNMIDTNGNISIITLSKKGLNTSNKR